MLNQNKVVTEANQAPATLVRSLSLWQVTLYGVGVTIGAGIYVLVGATAGHAGIYAPVSFLVAAIVMVLSAISYAEFAGRVPVSDGSAAYVREGFKSDSLGLLIGLCVIFAGIVSAAAIAIGSTGYIREFITIPQHWLVLIVVLVMGGIASWGIAESVTFAGMITLIEVIALVAIIALGFGAQPELIYEFPTLIPPLADMSVWITISGAGLLAFFAFIGFEDIVVLAEETKRPEHDLPIAIFLTLAIATILYFLVTALAVLSVPIEELEISHAPLSHVFTSITGMSPAVISVVAIFATVNGVIIQIIMASRILYGLGNKGSLPSILATVHPHTRTPLVATWLVVACILVLALAFPLQGLAELTSRLILGVFAMINLSLIMVKIRNEPAPDGIFTVGIWMPVAGLLSSLGLLISDLT